MESLLPLVAVDVKGYIGVVTLNNARKRDVHELCHGCRVCQCTSPRRVDTPRLP